MTFDRDFIRDLVKPIIEGKAIGTFSKNEMVIKKAKPHNDFEIFLFYNAFRLSVKVETDESLNLSQKDGWNTDINLNIIVNIACEKLF